MEITTLLWWHLLAIRNEAFVLYIKNKYIHLFCLFIATLLLVADMPCEATYVAPTQ